MGEESKPVPVLDTGAEGEQDSPTMLPCGYCLEASTSLRHGGIQQVLSVAFPVLTYGLRIKSAMT